MELAPFITVGLVRGRARGVGSEFLQALDVRFASRELAVLSQIEIGTGIVPGGGGLDRLPRLVGRSRATEAIVGCDDFDADTAERYGWVNRFESRTPNWTRLWSDLRHVSRASTVASSRPERKSSINGQVSRRPPTSWPSQKEFFKVSRYPETQARLASLLQRGLQHEVDFEINLASTLLRHEFRVE